MRPPAPERPRVVFHYERGHLVPYVVSAERCYRLRELPRHFRSVQEAARWCADRFPASSLLGARPPSWRDS